MGAAATDVPTANVIAAAISTAVQAAQGTLESAVSALEEEVGELSASIGELETAVAAAITSMGAGNADEIVLSTATGGIKRSAKKIGGATLAASPDANTVATEAAVSAAFSWQAL